MRIEHTLLLVTVLAMALPAAAAEPSLELSVAEQAVSVGDRVAVQVFARADDQLMWADPEVVVDGDSPWAVADGPSAVAGASPPVWTLTLIPLEVGDLELPDVMVSARPADGDSSMISAAERPSLTVASVLSGEAPEPAPMRDPVGVSGWAWEWISPVAAVVLPLLLLGALGWRYRRRGGVAPAAPSLPPLEELEAALADLSARLGRDPSEGVCDRVAFGVRRYIERRTGEPALEMTTFEIRSVARQRAWPDGVRRDVQRAMDVADSVRFGRRQTAESELQAAIDAALAGARALEQHLRPEVEETAAVGGGA